MSNMGGYQIKNSQHRTWKHVENNALRNALLKRKAWALYRSVSELVLSLKERWSKMQDKVKLACRGAMHWKTSIFQWGTTELFTGGWMSWYWVPKRDEAGVLHYRTRNFAQSQRRMKQRMRKMTTRQMKEIVKEKEKESIDILFDIT